MVLIFALLGGLLTIIAAIVVGYFAVNKILPHLKEHMTSYLKDTIVVGGLVKFVTLLIWLTVMETVLEGLVDIADSVEIGSLTYLKIFGPAFNVINFVLEDIKWLIYIGAILLIGMNLVKGQPPQRPQPFS